MNDDLPPLPQYDYGDYDFDEDRFIEAYTAEKMRDYAKQAVEAEREACAQACEYVLELYRGSEMGKGAELVGDHCAEAIRARGNT